MNPRPSTQKPEDITSEEVAALDIPDRETILNEIEKPVKNEEPAEVATEKPVLRATHPMKAVATMVEEYTRRLYNDKRAQQFVAGLSIMVKQSPKIEICTPESLGTAMMACVHLDLMPNTPSQHAFIIPYMNNRTHRYEAQFQIGYKGILELAYRTGQIKSISAELVYPEDKFKVTLGSVRRLRHEPSFEIDRTEYKRATHVYATAILLNGEVVFDVMGKSELDKIQKSAKAKSTDSPWQSWPEAMAKKTVIKRMLKLLPASASDQRVAIASAVDSWAEAGKLALSDGILIEQEVETVPEEVTDEPKVDRKALQAKLIRHAK